MNSQRHKEASPAQATVQVAADNAPAGLMAVVIVRDRKIGEALRYAIAEAWLPGMAGWNELPPLERYDEAMHAAGLFDVEPYTAA